MSRNTVFLILACLILKVESAKILGIFHYYSKSHHIVGEALLKALARRGHEVTMISPYHSEPMKNYEDIEITGLMDSNRSNSDLFITMQDASTIKRMTVVHSFTPEVSEKFLSHETFQNFLSSGRKYDLVLLNWFFNTAFLGIGHYFDAPVVLFSSFGSITEINRLTGNPSPYSYVPYLLSAYPTEMTYVERVGNTIISLVSEYRERFFNFPAQERLLAKYFPNAPPLHDLVDNISVVLLNTHFSVENPRPYLPIMIPIGGFHIEESEEIHDEFKKFLDDAKEGIVYFSLGTNLKVSELPKEKLSAITKALAKLPLKVLWKFEGEDLSGIPPNVKVSKWFPQTAILAHPNTKLFITHGGLLSTTEAVHFGLPILGIPFFADQHKNIAFSVSNGYALKLLYNDLTEDSLATAVAELLNNPRYRENVQRRSRALRDQPLKPLDNAIFWTEYALRQKGSPLLRSISVRMPWYQYYLLDVFSLFAVILVAISIVIYVISRVLIRVVKGLVVKGPRKILNQKKAKKA